MWNGSFAKGLLRFLHETEQNYRSKSLDATIVVISAIFFFLQVSAIYYTTNCYQNNKKKSAKQDLF